MPRQKASKTYSKSKSPVRESLTKSGKSFNLHQSRSRSSDLGNPSLASADVSLVQTYPFLALVEPSNSKPISGVAKVVGNSPISSLLANSGDGRWSTLDKTIVCEALSLDGTVHGTPGGKFGDSHQCTEPVCLNAVVELMNLLHGIAESV